MSSNKEMEEKLDKTISAFIFKRIVELEAAGSCSSAAALRQIRAELGQMLRTIAVGLLKRTANQQPMGSCLSETMGTGCSLFNERASKQETVLNKLK